MSVKKTLTNIVLTGVLGLGVVGCDTPSINNQTIQTESQNQTRKLSGKITSIDEDSFFMSIFLNTNPAAAEFPFENLRILGDDGREYTLIFPGPSNYQEGDEVDIVYRELNSPVTYKELAQKYYGKPRSVTMIVQKGQLRVDGIIDQ